MDLYSILQERQVKEVFKPLHERYMAGDFDEDMLEIWGYVLHLLVGDKKIYDQCYDLVVSRLPPPPVITVNDLLTAFVHHVLLSHEVSFDEAYDRFCLGAHALTCIFRRSEPVPTFVYERPHQLDELKTAPLGRLWWREDERDTRVAISVAGRLLAGPLVPEQSSEEGPVIPYVMLEGYFTEAALREAISEIRDVATTLLKSFYMLEDLEFTDPIVGLIRTPDPASGRCVRVVKQRTPDPQTERQRRTIDLDFPVLNLTELRELLDAYFSEATKKDSLARRIRNAVHLLVEADRQSKNGIGLALSVVAMETLLCRKGDELGNLLAENVAVLLEPELAHRGSAVEFVKKLYDQRSLVLHGSVTDFPSDDLWSARFLASGVLKAFVARRLFRRALGENDQTPDELLKELKTRKFKSKRDVWDFDSPVVELWR